MKYFKLEWKDGKAEIVKGREFKRAFNSAGYGNASLSLLKSHSEVEATDDETIDYIRLMSRANGGFSPDWNKISEEGRSQWRERATEHKFKNFNTLPQKFPRIK